MADGEVTYVDRFRIREGKLEDLRRYAHQMVALVEEKEPGVLSFNYYVDDDGTEGTAVFVFASPEALDLHMDLTSSKWQEGVELLSGTEIELLGRPSERAVEMARSFDARLKERLAGFSRYAE